MPKAPAIHLTDTQLTVLSFNQLRANPDAHQALRDWCADHGIEPDEVLTSEPIFRNTGSPRISYGTYLRDITGERRRHGGDFVKSRMVKTLDRDPAPWPAAVVELAERTRA